MIRIDVSKFLFYAVSIISGLGLSFAFGLYSGAKQTVVYEAVKDLKITIDEVPILLKIHPKHFLQPARYEGDGVTVNDAPDQEERILLSSFFGGTNELRLIRRDGDVIARWPVRFSEIFPDPSHLPSPPATDWNIDTHGALILPDGSVVFNFEFGGLVKLNRCGDLIWALPRATHHSVERAEDGGYWVPGRRYISQESDSPFPPYETPFVEDTILKVSEDGEVLAEISVPEIFYKNGLEAILTSSGHRFKAGMLWDKEIVHLNKIEELTSDIADDFPMFESGDLLISMKYLNMLMVINPDTGEIKWSRIGPWLRQHDPVFKPGGTIVVFNNNIYRKAFGGGLTISHISVPRVSNIVEIDPATDNYQIIYGSRKGQEMLSIIRGKQKLTPHGGLLVTEFEGGRIFETDATGNVIWEYINRYSSEEVAEITEARIYAESYFRVSDWSCEGRGE